MANSWSHLPPTIRVHIIYKLTWDRLTLKRMISHVGKTPSRPWIKFFIPWTCSSLIALVNEHKHKSSSRYHIVWKMRITFIEVGKSCFYAEYLHLLYRPLLTYSNFITINCLSRYLVNFPLISCIRMLYVFDDPSQLYFVSKLLEILGGCSPRGKDNVSWKKVSTYFVSRAI